MRRRGEITPNFLLLFRIGRRVSQLPVQPGPGERPHPVRGARRDPQGLGGLRDGMPGEVAELDQLRCLRVLGRQPREGGVQGDALPKSPRVPGTVLLMKTVPDTGLSCVVTSPDRWWPVARASWAGARWRCRRAPGRPPTAFYRDSRPCTMECYVPPAGPGAASGCQRPTP